MAYYPNREPMMLLKCDCIELGWGMLSFFGTRKKPRLWCHVHGEQIVVREATSAEVLAFNKLIVEQGRIF